MATRALQISLRFFNNAHIISNNLNLLCANKQYLQRQIPQRCIDISSRRNRCNTADIDTVISMKKKKPYIPKITLLSEKNDINIVSLEEAEKIAKRRNLKLVKIVNCDTKSQRPVYKLMHLYEIIQIGTENKIKRKETINDTVKTEKTISISSKIFNNDLTTKIKSIRKMLGKNHGVRVVVTIDGSKDLATGVRDRILTDTKDISKVISQGSSELTMKLILYPITDNLNTEDSNNKN